MPQNLTDVSTFTDPVVAPVDADPADAASVVTPLQALANRTRFLRNYCTDQGVQLPAAVTHSRYFGPSSAVFRASDWSRRSAGASPDDFDGVLRSELNVGELYIDLTKRLPRGASLARVRALVRPAAARSGGNRMSLGLFGVSFGVSFASPSITATSLATADEDDGSTNLQWLALDLTSSPVAVATYAVMHARIYAGSDGATNKDYVYGAMVEFTASTIRND